MELIHALTKEKLGKIISDYISERLKKGNYQIKGYEKDNILIIIKNFKNAQIMVILNHTKK